MKKYLNRMKPVEKSPPGVSHKIIFWSWLGSFLGISAVTFINYNLISQTDLVMLIGSFGASAVLIYGAVQSPLAQPRNLMGGHFISALIGVACFKIIGSIPWFSAGLAVSSSIAVMHYLRCLHPPGGATALIAVIGSEKIHALGYLYAFIPAALGALIMLVIALLVNNLTEDQKYPKYWI
ncbi:MAG: HPP family protein [Spirochaetia bacterium]|nr:HPP family protein [Spirochaetia bacterium]